MAGLVILDAVSHHPQLARQPSIQVARADLLHRLGRTSDAIGAYQHALELHPSPAERRFIHRQLQPLHDNPPAG